METADWELLDRYKRTQRDRGLSPDTLRSYSAIYQPFIRHLRGRGLTLLTAQRDDISDWIATRGNVTRTRAIYLSRITILYRWLQEEDYRTDLPTKGIGRPKIPRMVPRPISETELYHALDHADARTGLMITLTAYAGLRRGELAKIDRADILDDRDPALLLVHGKGSKERLVPLSPVVLEALYRYGIPARGPLFVNAAGEALKRETIGLLISGHYRAWGIDSTAHPGRHRFITSLYQTTLDLRLCQEMAGHSSPATTAGYAAWTPTRAAAAVAGLPTAGLRAVPPIEAAR